MSRVQIKDKKSLVEIARQGIENQILNGVLRPDQRLVESELAAQLGISRTPLREALSQLEIKGIVKKRNDIGYVVVYHSLKDIKNNFEVRIVLESSAIKLACEKASRKHLDRAAMYLARFEEDFINRNKRAIDLTFFNSKQDWNSFFHKEMYDAAGNELLTNYIMNLRDLERLKRVTLNFTLSDYRTFQAQHYKILEAVKQRDKSKAQKAVQSHLKTLYSFYYRLPY